MMNEGENTLQFVLYGLLSERKKGEGIGKRVISILEQMAKTKKIEKLQLMTTKACEVKEYYEKKHGFKEKPTNSGYILLERKI